MATITRKKGGAYRVNTGEGTWDEVSHWTHASDVTFDDNKTLENKYQYASDTLEAGETTVVIWSSLITADGMLDIYVPVEFCTVTPTAITQSNGMVTITFPAQSANMEVRVRCT